MFFLLLLFGFFSQPSFSAPCCGGASQVPALIVGDDKVQLSTSLSHSEVADDVWANGIWQKRENREITESLKFEGAWSFAEAFQVGAGLPLNQRRIESPQGNRQAFIFGDSTLSVAYEALPELEYNLYKPKIFLYTQWTLPTGKSIYETSSLVDVSGQGFWTPSLGVVFSKIIHRFDWQVVGEVHKSLDKEVGQTLLIPGWGQSLGVGAGYSYKDWRLGSSLTFYREDAIHSVGNIESDGAVKRYATAVLNLGYAFPQEISMTLSYSDQRLFGDPQNTTLSRGILLAFQKRWPK